MEVKKISGQFKMEQHALNFVMIGSVIDTSLKNRMYLVASLELIAKDEFQFGNSSATYFLKKRFDIIFHLGC